MGQLVQADGATSWCLRDRNILGRSRACTIRLGDPAVSGEHAVLRWTGRTWEVQDLHSRNGTFVDGRALAPGACADLLRGSVLGLGRPDGHVLADAGEPAAFATDTTGARPPVVAEAGILPLPGPHGPEATVWRDEHRWWCEQSGVAAPIDDGAVIRTGDETWRLHLPEHLPRTLDAADAAPRLADIRLRFAVRRDEQHVELTVLHGERAYDLKARSHHHLLLLLARARLDPRALPDEQRGWVDQEHLLAQLRIDRSQLHLAVYRARRQLGEAGIQGAARIVERSSDRKLRLGVALLEICALPDVDT